VCPTTVSELSIAYEENGVSSATDAVEITGFQLCSVDEVKSVKISNKFGVLEQSDDEGDVPEAPEEQWTRVISPKKKVLASKKNRKQANLQIGQCCNAISACERDCRALRELEICALSSADVPWVKEHGGRRYVEVTVDSGAAATVVPVGAFSAPIRQTPKVGVQTFRSASGGIMHNKGEQQIQGV